MIFAWGQPKTFVLHYHNRPKITETYWPNFHISSLIKRLHMTKQLYRKFQDTWMQFHSSHFCIVLVIIYDSESLEHNSKIIWSHDVLWESIELLRTNLKDENGRQLGSPKLLWYRRKNVFEDANGTDASCISFKIGSLLPPSGHLCRVSS